METACYTLSFSMMVSAPIASQQRDSSLVALITGACFAFLAKQWIRLLLESKRQQLHQSAKYCTILLMMAQLVKALQQVARRARPVLPQQNPIASLMARNRPLSLTRTHQTTLSLQTFNSMKAVCRTFCSRWL
jgi:uncharacterized membrane protein (UPF0136 family)